MGYDSISIETLVRHSGRASYVSLARIFEPIMVSLLAEKRFCDVENQPEWYNQSSTSPGASFSQSTWLYLP